MGQMIGFQVTNTRNDYNSLDGHYTTTVGTLILPYSTYTIEFVKKPDWKDTLPEFQDQTMAKIYQLNPQQLATFDGLLKAEVRESISIFKKAYINGYHIEERLNIFRENIDVDYDLHTDGLVVKSPTCRLATVLYPQVGHYEIGTITIDNRSYKIYLSNLHREELSLIVDKINQLSPAKRSQIAQKIETQSIDDGFKLKNALSSI